MALIKHGNNALSNVTAFPSAVPTGKLKLLSTATASSSSSIEFTSGIDSTYDIYKFEFTDIHVSSDSAVFRFNLSTDSGSNYNVTKTTSYFRGFHSENGVTTALDYRTPSDLAQSTSDQDLSLAQGSDNDQSLVGQLYLFNPSSTTYVKHFIVTTQSTRSQDGSQESFIAGYGNTTSAVDAIKFVVSSGNIDAGTIKMYGISA